VYTWSVSHGLDQRRVVRVGIGWTVVRVIQVQGGLALGPMGPEGPVTMEQERRVKPFQVGVFLPTIRLRLVRIMTGPSSGQPESWCVEITEKWYSAALFHNSVYR